MRRITHGRSNKMTSKTAANRSAKEICPGTGAASAGVAATCGLHPVPLVSPKAAEGFRFEVLSTLAAVALGGAIG